MTPKQKVLATYPKARARESRGGALYNWWVFPDHTGAFSIGAGWTARDAWANAAQQISERDGEKN